MQTGGNVILQYSSTPPLLKDAPGSKAVGICMFLLIAGSLVIPTGDPFSLSILGICLSIASVVAGTFAFLRVNLWVLLTAAIIGILGLFTVFFSPQGTLTGWAAVIPAVVAIAAAPKVRDDTLTISAAVTRHAAPLIIMICSVIPLLWMAAVLIANPSVRAEFSLDAFRVELLGRTVGYNLIAAVIATMMGLPAGYVLGRGRGMFAKVLWVVLPAALLLPSLSYAYGWAQLVRIIRPGFRWLGETEFHTPAIAWLHLGATVFHLPIHVTFRPNGPADVFRCIWSLGSWLWAVPAGLIGLSLRRMDASVQQQALLDGALRRVTLRQLVGPIVASMAIVTVLATQEFAVYEPTGISVVATEVRMVFDTGAVSSPDNSIAAVNPQTQGGGARSPDQAARAAAAVACATPLLLVTVLLAIIAAWGASRSSASDTVAVNDWPPVLNASRWTVRITLALIVLNIGVPVGALICSLRGGPFDGVAPRHEHLSFLSKLAAFCHSHSLTNMWDEFGPQVQGALLVASEAGAIAAIAALSSGGRWVRGMLAITGASFLIGGQLLAIALIRIFNRPGLDWAYDISVVPVIAYVGRFGWLAIAAGRSTWSRPWRELRDVASVDGAGAIRTAGLVIWPLAWPMLLAGGLLVGALSLTEVPATVLLMPQNPQVLTPTLMTWVHMARFDPMIEASLLMMATVLFPAVAAVILTGFGLRKARRGLPR